MPHISLSFPASRSLASKGAVPLEQIHFLVSSAPAKTNPARSFGQKTKGKLAMFNHRVNEFLRLNPIRRQTQTRSSPQIGLAIANSPYEKMKSNLKSDFLDRSLG